MTNHDIQVTLRLPANWSYPKDLLERLPEGYRLTPEFLVMPDGSEFEIKFRKPDDQFVGIFATMCRRPPTDEEKLAIENYSVQVCLTGPGGSIESARGIMRAAVVMIQSGSSGVFIDNSGLSFGGSQWCLLAEDESLDSLTFAFVGIITGKKIAHTTGMHILGLPDIQMNPKDLGADGQEMIEMIQYLARKEREVGTGHILADIHGPRFHVTEIDDEPSMLGHPMYNPWGRLKLTSVQEIAESN